MSFLIILPYTFNQYTQVGRIVLALWVAFILLTISFSVYRIKVGGKIALILLIVTLMFIALSLYMPTYTFNLLNRISSSITLAFVTIIVFLDLATDNVTASRPLTADYIWGGIATYLLIGLTFASLFTLLELVVPGSFTAVAPSGPLEFPLFIYYSYYVLTTIGGVLTPITLQAQSLVMIEPIIGTLYIAILIARLVNRVTVKGRKNSSSQEPVI